MAQVAGVQVRAPWIERNARWLLLGLIVIYVIVFFALAYYKYEGYGQGYDQVDFEQAIWNTTQGRLLADSRFSFSDTILGMDWMPGLLAFVPFYALLPSAHTLFFLQVVAAASGAVPVYLLARDRIGSTRAGLVFAAGWLIYPTVEYVTLSPFQIRVFAVVLLLWALWLLERGRFWLCLLCLALALTIRTDVALVVAMFGLYELLGKRRWQFVLVPLGLGLGYFLVVMLFVNPLFIHLPDTAACTGPVALANIQDKWPGGKNPNTGYYLHWGCTTGEIVVNLLKNPIYTLRYMFLGPPPSALVGIPDMATFIAQGQRFGYLAALLAPFAFLSLLAPRGLVLALPILGLNLLAWRSAQVDYTTQYQILITVGVVAASIEGYRLLATWLAYWRGFGVLPQLGGGLSWRPPPDPRAGQRAVRAAWLRRNGPLLAVLVVAILVNLVLKDAPLRTLASGHESPATVAALNALVAEVPPDAHVAASSKVAPHLLPRRYIYNFPPAPYSPSFDRVEYVLVAPAASADVSNPLPGGKTALQALVLDSGQFRLVDERAGYRLFQRTEP